MYTVDLRNTMLTFQLRNYLSKWSKNFRKDNLAQTPFVSLLFVILVSNISYAIINVRMHYIIQNIHYLHIRYL